MNSECPFCYKINKFVGDPYHVNVKCITCQHDFFHVPCGACNKVMKFRGLRNNFNTTCNDKKLAYRCCDSCQEHNFYDLSDNNSVLYCKCGNNVDSTIHNKKYSYHMNEPVIPCVTKIRPLTYKLTNNKMKIDVKCDLKDIFTGNAYSQTIMSKKFNIKIEKGYKEGTLITYDNERLGNNFYDVYDIEFTVKYPNMMNMEIVNKNDLKYKINKNKFKPDKKYKITIPHPKKEFSFALSYDIIKAGKIIFTGEGIYNRKIKQNGDFIVEFV
jgi:hypothetical protein